MTCHKWHWLFTNSKFIVKFKKDWSDFSLNQNRSSVQKGVASSFGEKSFSPIQNRFDAQYGYFKRLELKTYMKKITNHIRHLSSKLILQNIFYILNIVSTSMCLPLTLHFFFDHLVMNSIPTDLLHQLATRYNESNVGENHRILVY